MSRGHDDRRRDWTARPEYDFMGRPLSPRPADRADRVEPPPVASGGEAQPDGEVAGLPRRRAAASLLSSHAALRQAILLAEIIGPPRALRPPDSTRDVR